MLLERKLCSATLALPYHKNKQTSNSEVLCKFTKASSKHPCCWRTDLTTTTTVLRTFFWDHPGEPVPKELLDFMVQGKINRGRHIDHPFGRHTIRTNQCPPPLSPHIFYGPDAFPATQPTVSKHCRRTDLVAT